MSSDCDACMCVSERNPINSPRGRGHLNKEGHVKLQCLCQHNALTISDDNWWLDAPACCCGPWGSLKRTSCDKKEATWVLSKWRGAVGNTIHHRSAWIFIRALSISSRAGENTSVLSLLHVWRFEATWTLLASHYHTVLSLAPLPGRERASLK